MSKLKHTFAKESSAISLFDGTTTLDEFKRRLTKLSKTLPLSDSLVWGRSIDPKQNANQIKGDAFELFCELFVGAFGTHPHVGLSDYVPVNSDTDEGVDAYAENLDLVVAAVQCKYISNVSRKGTLTANGSNLANFPAEATIQGIDWAEESKIKRLFLFTTAIGLHYSTVEKWNDRVHVIGRKTISLLVDNNPIFWRRCIRKLKEV